MHLFRWSLGQYVWIPALHLCRWSVRLPSAAGVLEAIKISSKTFLKAEFTESCFPSKLMLWGSYFWPRALDQRQIGWMEQGGLSVC